jgi:hypothetical protein
VAAFGTEPVPADSIVDGAIIGAVAVVDAIRRVFDGNKAFKGKNVLCLPLRQCRHREEDYAARRGGLGDRPDRCDGDGRREADGLVHGIPGFACREPAGDIHGTTTVAPITASRN